MGKTFLHEREGRLEILAGNKHTEMKKVACRTGLKEKHAKTLQKNGLITKINFH